MEARDGKMAATRSKEMGILVQNLAKWHPEKFFKVAVAYFQITKL